MPDTTWSIEGREFTNCNCAYGCPCQFNARPTHNQCEAILAIEIDKGFHGRTKLDGLRIAGVYKWPGAVHEGRGHAQFFIDGRANADQRAALLKIMKGEDTQPGATMLQVFHMMSEKVHDPIFTAIEFDIDIAKRSARVRIPDLIEAYAEPILNPVTGAKKRARIDLESGFEFKVAEVGRGWSESKGAVGLKIVDSHAHFCNIRLTDHGIPA